jgi:hypothetical protein
MIQMMKMMRRMNIMTNKTASDLIAMIEVKEPGEFIVNSRWGSFVMDYKEALQMAVNVLKDLPEAEAKEDIDLND